MGRPQDKKFSPSAKGTDYLEQRTPCLRVLSNTVEALVEIKRQVTLIQEKQQSSQEYNSEKQERDHQGEPSWDHSQLRGSRNVSGTAGGQHTPQQSGRDVELT